MALSDLFGGSQMPPGQPQQGGTGTWEQIFQLLPLLIGAAQSGKSGFGPFMEGWQRADEQLKGQQQGQQRLQMEQQRIAGEAQDRAFREKQLLAEDARRKAEHQQGMETSLVNALGGVEDKAAYDELINQHEALAGVAPHTFRTKYPFTAPNVQKRAAAAWKRVSTGPGKDAIRQGTQVEFDMNGDGVPERIPIETLAELAGQPLLYDENQAPVFAPKEAKPPADKFQETLKAALDVFQADNKRPPTAKERQALIAEAIATSSEEARRPPDPEMADLRKQGAQLQNQIAALTLAGKQSVNQPKDIQPGSKEFKVAQDLAYGKLTMAQFRSLYAYSRDIGTKTAIYEKASELNPDFNPAQFEMGFHFASNVQTQRQLASLDNARLAVPDLLKASDAAKRSGVTALNRFIVPGGVAIGGKRYSNFGIARKAFADELSGALGFGNATDMKLELGLDMTDPSLSADAFAEALQTIVVPFVERKRDTMLKQMSVYGQPGMNPAAPQPSPAKPTTAPRRFNPVTGKLE